MFFFHVHWRDSIDVYTLNTPHSFVFDLPSVLTLEADKWEVALIDFKFQSTSKDPIYVLTDICEDSYIHGVLLPVLQRLDTKSGRIPFPQFIKVSKQEVQSIKIQIKNRSMKDIQLRDFYCTLCLRQTALFEHV